MQNRNGILPFVGLTVGNVNFVAYARPAGDGKVLVTVTRYEGDDLDGKEIAKEVITGQQITTGMSVPSSKRALTQSFESAVPATVV